MRAAAVMMIGNRDIMIAVVTIEAVEIDAAAIVAVMIDGEMIEVLAETTDKVVVTTGAVVVI